MPLPKHLPGRRQQVCLLESAKYGLVVEKRFSDPASAEREAAVYRLLQGMDSVALLEDQEQNRLDMAPWCQLVDWLLMFHSVTGYSKEDVNLRNFLYLPDENAVAGLNFEQCMPEPPGKMLSAF